MSGIPVLFFPSVKENSQKQSYNKPTRLWSSVSHIYIFISTFLEDTDRNWRLQTKK